MTICNATVCDEFAVISCDTYMAPEQPDIVEAQSTSDLNAALSSNMVGDGTTPTVEPIGCASKIIPLPHLNMVVAGIGNFDFFTRWTAGLMRTAFETDVAKLNPFAAEQLRLMAQWFGDVTVRVIHIGWDANEGRPAGFVYGSGDGFEPIELTGGHTTAPPPNPDDSEYAELANRFELAAAGIDVEQFHLALAQNQYRAFAAGKLADGVLLGGDLITARIDAAGIHIRKALRFPGLSGATEAQG